MEKVSLLPNRQQPQCKRSACNRLCHFIMAFTFCSLLALTAVWFIAPVSNETTTSAANFNHFTSYISTVINGKHFVHRDILDQESNQFRVDAIMVKHDEGEQQVDLQAKIDQAAAFLAGEKVFLDHKHFGIPISILFDNGNLYGIYPHDGTPACRLYHHDYQIPVNNPLEGATNHGLTYAHKIVLATHYSGLHIPPHGGHTPQVDSSDIWVEAFSGKPLAVSVSATVDHDGESHQVEVFHHFFRFYNYVDHTQLAPPSELVDICQDIPSDVKMDFENDEIMIFKDLMSFVML